MKLDGVTFWLAGDLGGDFKTGEGEWAVLTHQGSTSPAQREAVRARFPGMTSEPIVIRNLPYVGAPRNDGFVLMPNDVEAYRKGPDAFEYKGTNGVTLTVDVNSNDPMPGVGPKN